MMMTLLSVALIIALILVVRRPFGRAYGAKAAYALWALPLIRLVMPPLPSWLSPTSFFASPLETGAGPAAASAAAGRAPTALPDMAGAAPTQPSAMGPAPVAPPAETGGAPWSEAIPAIDTFAAILVPGVFLIAALIIAHQFWRQWRFTSLITANALPVSPELARRARQVQRDIGLKRTIPVRASLVSSGPLVTGVLRPVILLPAWFEDDYTPAEQHVALTHEAMHVKRGDLIALQAANIVAALQWFNPLSWIALKAFRADQEAACDADVLALHTTTPRAYGATLLKAIRQARAEPTPAFVAALPLNHAIKDRFAMLAQDTPPPRKQRTALALTLAAGAALMVVTATTVTAQEPELDGGEETSTRIIIDRSAQTHVITRSRGGQSNMVILTEPMADLDALMAEIEDMDIPEPPSPPTPPDVFPPAPPAPPAIDLSFLGALESLEALSSLEALGDSVSVIEDGSTLVISINTEDMEAFEAQIEADAARFEEEVERWSEQLEAQFEQGFDVQMEAFEAQMEAFETQIEAITESPAFHTAVSRGRDSIKFLSDACRDVDFDEVDLAVIESPEGDKAVCVNPDGEAGAINAAIMADPSLSEAEKRRFLDRAERQVHIDIHRD